MLYKKIEKYLSGVGIKITDVNNQFELVDNSDGNGPFIKEWKVDGVDEPSQSQLDAISTDDILLQKAKDSKKAELKALRESNLNDSTPRAPGTYSGNLSDKLIKVNVNVHLPIFESIISRLERAIERGITNPTRKWTDANGNRMDLDLADYKSLVKHLEVRDENEHTLYGIKKAEIKALTTLEAVEAYDINPVTS